jgi:acyl-CoA reductase-like NAD-dependent aldehyde dehydrogenase
MDFQGNFSLTIAGQAVTTISQIEVINPANGLAFASAPLADADDLDAAVSAARAALPEWKNAGYEARACRLNAFAASIEGHADELAALFVREQGRPFAFAKREIVTASEWLRKVATQRLQTEIAEDSAERRVEIRYEPLGVVGAIVPWNFPIMLAIWKIAPALLSGNSMVLKPSPFTPLCALKLGELSRATLPAGVLNVISGDDSLGPMMTAHPGISKISFTGSTATGKKVMASASNDLKRITLELGGNDAAIVLPDVDLDAVTEPIFFGAFYNTGQVCIATKRLYIHEDIYDDLRDRLYSLVKLARVGEGSRPDVAFGPIQNLAQYHRVLSLIEDARSQGLTILQGMDVPEDGYFIPLTLVDNPPEDSRVVTEEAFGPVLPLLKFRDIDDVIARANNSEFGLAGTVWSKDIDKAVEIASRIETGTVWINHNLRCLPHVAFAGAKQSGFGVENGKQGLLEFTQPKAIYIPKVATS